MRPCSIRLALLAVLLLLAAPALARAEAAADSTAAQNPELFDTDRPDVTNGSTRMDPGVVQLETGWSRTAAHGAALSSFGDALIRIGVARAFELRLFTPGVERLTSGRFSDDQFGEAGAGFKLGRTSRDGQRGVAVIAGVSVPLAHPASSTNAEAVLAGDWGSDALGASANLGVHRVSDHDLATTSWLTSLSLGHEISKRVSAFAELAGERPTDAPWAKFADTGASWAVARLLQLDASVGRTLERGGAWTIGAGVSKRW